MARVANYKGDPHDLLKENKSGLMNYMFGSDRDGFITQDDFIRFQQDLINDVLYLEFLRYASNGDGGTPKDKISELDFCRHLVYNANIPAKKKAKMFKRVEKKFSKGTGVDFRDFKNFYYVLFGGADLERAMFFLDSEKKGVTRDEFYNIAFWVAHKDISDHVIDVIFTLLDENLDERLSVKEFQPVLFQWRHSRGFQKSALQVSLGSLKM